MEVDQKVKTVTSKSIYTTIEDEKQKETIKKELLELIYKCEFSKLSYSKQNKLPGPMPHTLTRESLNKYLGKRRYWVSEKSDGVRSLLFFQKKTETLYLIDRSWKIDQVNISIANNKAWSENCIFDGEIVFDLLQNRSMFRIFDILYSNTVNYTLVHLPGRFKAISAWFTLFSETDQVEFPITIKTFRKKESVSKCFVCIQSVNGEMIYTDTYGSNKNDGLVFTPVEEGYFCKDLPIFKWKWHWMNSVDFLLDWKNVLDVLNWSTKVLDLYVECAEDPGKAIYETSIINDISRSWLHSAVQHNNQSKYPIVVECARSLKPEESRNWQIIGLRSDKIVGNFIKTAQSVDQAFQENITLEEITKLCSTLCLN